MSLHQQIRKKASNGYIKLSELKPNSREIASRMIEQGQLLKTAKGFAWHEAKR